LTPIIQTINATNCESFKKPSIHFINMSGTPHCVGCIYWLSLYWHPFIRRVLILTKKCLLPSSCPSVCLSVCPSGRMYQRGSHWTDFRGIWYWGALWKSVEKFQYLVNSGHFTWRPKYVHIVAGDIKSPQKRSLRAK
jgi:hypothetical protein